MRRTPLLILILCAAYLPAFSQGEIPVDMYTGTPSISLPIWTVASGSVSIPISLSYNANALQQRLPVGPGWSLSAGGSVSREVRSFPDDETGTVKGWMYTVSGFTSAAATIDGFTITADTIAGTSITDESADYTKINGFAYGVDTEPDVFNYNVEGYTGSFVLGTDMLPHGIPHQDVKIEYETVSSTDKQIIGFTITTPQGYVYSFYSLVNVNKNSGPSGQGFGTYYTRTEYDQYSTSVSYTTEWKLTSVYGPDGSNIIFTYVNGLSTSSNDIKEIALYQSPDASYAASLRKDALYYEAYRMGSSRATLLPATITGSNGSKVEFVYTNFLLKSINISDDRRGTTPTERFIKNFALEHVPIIYATDIYGYNPVEVVEFLQSVTENSGCDRIPPYKFEYAGVHQSQYNPGYYLPMPKGTDLWGYPNGRTQEHAIPKIYIYPDEAASERYRTSPIPVPIGREYILDGVSRESSGSAMRLGTLQTITSPEGGTTSFEFEANSYIDGRTGLEEVAGGLRIRSISYFDGFNHTPIKKTFEYGQGQLIRKPIYAMPAYRYKDAGGAAYDRTYTNPSMTDEQKWKYLTVRTSFDLSPGETTHGSVVGYKTVTVRRPGAGYSVHEFYVPAAYGQTSHGKWKPASVRFARPSSVSLGIATDVSGTGNTAGGGPWTFPFSPSPDYDYQRGLQWRKSDYDESNNLVRRTVTTYQDIYKVGTAPTKVWGLRYERLPGCDPSSRIFFYGKYGMLTDAERVPQKEVNIIYDPSTSTYLKDSAEYFYDSPNHKYLSKVRRYTSDGKIYTSYVKYAKDYSSTNSGNADAIAIYYAPVFNRPGLVIESYETMKKAADSAEYVISGSAVKLSAMGMGAQWQLVRSSWQLKTNPPILLSSFVPASVITDGYGASKFKIDLRYERMDSILSYSLIGNVKATTSPMSRKSVVTGYGYSSTIPIVQLFNAQLGSATEIQAAFSDFETSTDFDFTGSTYYYGTGHTGLKAFYAKESLSKVITRAPAVSNYLVSFWAKTNTAFTLKVSLQPAAGGTEYSYVNVSVPNTSSEYKYIQAVVPLTSVPAAPGQFKVVLQASSLPAPPAGNPSAGQLSTTLVNVIDDVFFYPENTDMVATTYVIPYGAASVTSSNGNTSFQEYDKLGRPRYLFDRERNILKRISYNYSLSSPLNAAFTLNASPEVNVPVTFSAVASPCVTETITYEWDWGTGTFVSGTASQNHTFTAPGTYAIRLRTSSISNGAVVATKTFNVVHPPLLADICAKGVNTFIGTTPSTYYSCTEITASPPTSSGVIFRVTPSNAISGETFSYQWQITDLATLNWVYIGTNSNQFTYSKVLPSTKSFAVRCTVTSNLGRSVISTSKEVIVTP
ncbi:MAG: PKD domain-containing protein [Cyclobacteriaceae bacterium]|nr:PKD domain-containing protein [Cyclobacteriaceae bacterium]